MGQAVTEVYIGTNMNRDDINLFHLDDCKEYNKLVWIAPAYECMCEMVVLHASNRIFELLLRDMAERLKRGFRDEV